MASPTDTPCRRRADPVTQVAPPSHKPKHRAPCVPRAPCIGRTNVLPDAPRSVDDRTCPFLVDVTSAGEDEKG